MENWIKAYQINTSGLSNGLSIPTGFVVSIDTIYITGINQTDDTINLEMQVNTYSNDTRDLSIKNDDVESVMKDIATLTAVGDDTDQIVVENGLFDLLESVYGIGNVILIEKTL